MNLNNKKILVTGADGFIGSHLVEALVLKGCDVRAFVYYNSFNSWGWLDTIPENILKKVEIFSGDIRDPNGVFEAMKGINVVFHLAALIAIPYSYHSPDSFVDTNIKGTLNILQAARKWNLEKVLITSTSEVYGTARYVPINEKHPMQGQSPYSASKIGADRIAESFYRSFETPVVTVRPFNTYGPRQSARAIIPTIITQILSGHKKIYLGDLRPSRDFNYINDTVDGFIALSECDKTIGKEINISSGKEYTVGEIASFIISEIGIEIKIENDENRVRPLSSEVHQLIGDNTLIRSLTSWEPKYNLSDGIRETIFWFKDINNLSRYKPTIYNI